MFEACLGGTQWDNYAVGQLDGLRGETAPVEAPRNPVPPIEWFEWLEC